MKPTETMKTTKTAETSVKTTRTANKTTDNTNTKTTTTMKEILNSAKSALVRFLSDDRLAPAIFLGAALLLAIVLGWVLGHNNSTVIQIVEQAAGNLHAADGISAAAVAVAGMAGAGKHIEGSPLTTDTANTEAPGLLRNEIDERIVKIRPMSTPLDQISRYGGSRLSGSMKVEYYSVDTKPFEAKVTKAIPATDERNPETTTVLKTDLNDIFQPSTTVMAPDIEASEGGPLVLYVSELSREGAQVIPVNHKYNGGPGFPAMPVGTRLVRMGRAATELDVTTPQYGALPTKSSNLCQIFKAQVEQTTFMKISNKEVGWTFSDQEEAAIIDMRMGMERNFLFGHQGRIVDPVKGEEVCLTGGIWNQTDNTFSYSAAEGLTEQTLVQLCRRAFANSAGSSKKVLLAGSDLIEKLHMIGSTRVMVNDAVVTKWGLDFTEIHSKFGTLYVMLAEVFDTCGMSGNGMVIDPEYITKYCHVPFRTESLNLRTSGVRNVDAIVITEASCLVLRYPQSHVRIVATKA